METSHPTLGQKKEKRGLQKIWERVRASMKSGSTKSTTSLPDASDTTATAVPTLARTAGAPTSVNSTILSNKGLNGRANASTTGFSSTTTTPGADVTSTPVPNTTSPPGPSSAEMDGEPLRSEGSLEVDATPAADVHVGDDPDTQLSSMASDLELDEATKRLQRAQAIFRKYDMDFNTAEWNLPPRPNTERVFKAPRMRVKWTCHECKATFGREKWCKGCAHERCRNCTRYPPPKKRKKPVDTDDHTSPSPLPDLRSVVCHDCRTSLAVGVAECPNCEHDVCGKCLKETIAEDHDVTDHPLPPNTSVLTASTSTTSALHRPTSNTSNPT